MSTETPEWDRWNGSSDYGYPAETPGGGGLTDTEKSYARLDPRIQWRGRWYSEASVEHILADRDAAAVQARAEVVARVEAVIESWPHGDNGQDYRRAVNQCRDAVRAALAGPNPRGGQDGGGE